MIKTSMIFKLDRAMILLEKSGHSKIGLIQEASNTILEVHEALCEEVEKNGAI